MVPSLPEKKKTEDETDLAHPDRTVPPSTSEATVIEWCRKNRTSSEIAKLFFEMADNGMPFFSTDEEAASWLSERAESDPSAAIVLGLMHNYGLGIQNSNEEAVRLYRLAAEQGLAIAQYSLGEMYFYGSGVPRSFEETAKWFTMAAEQGLALAQYRLGLCYERGEGVPQSDSKAVKWYRLAAFAGPRLGAKQFGPHVL